MSETRKHVAIAAGLFLLLAGCGRPSVPRETLSISAAADLKFALDEVSQEFKRQNPGLDVQVAYGSSGNFFSQLQNGAPFDLFLSADIAYPKKLVDAGFADGGSLFTYAVGRVVLWTPASSPLDVAALEMRTLESPSVHHIAIANPEHAPYGRAAEAALRSLGVYDRVKPKLVLGENIAQTLQFVQSGAAEAGIVALSLALAPPVREQGKYWEIPLDAYPRMEQGGVILNRAKNSKAAAAYRGFLLSRAGRSILKRYGFTE